jgi:hypothetical protein
MKDEHWLVAWNEYMAYMKKNKRRPSKYHQEDMKLVNWLKYNRKIRNKGLLSEERSKKLDILLKEAEAYRRINQHQYLHKENFESDNRDNEQ